MGRRWLLPVLGLLYLSSLTGCADRPRRNPLDAQSRSPVDLADPLQALAGDGSVRLRWNFTRFEDLLSVRIRRDGGDDGPQLFERPPADTSFTDTAVVNGVIYRYWLALDVAAQGELAIAGEQLATPGPESAWIADAGSGLVWRLTPDGRRGLFARGRFRALAGLAVDRRTGAAWVSDSRHNALHRIDSDGTLHRFGTRMLGGGPVRVDANARVGWAADAAAGAVYRFPLDAEGDTLQLQEIDATLSHPMALASSPRGGVWVADDAAHRVLWFSSDGFRGGQWEGLHGLVDLDASSEVCCQAWAIDAEGQRLLRLTPRAPARVVDFPYGPALAVDVADGSGVAWILGEGGIVAYDAEGGILLQIADVAGATSLFADENNGQLWVAGPSELWKITLGGLTYRTQLTGFTRIDRISVDPGT